MQGLDGQVHFECVNCPRLTTDTVMDIWNGMDISQRHNPQHIERCVCDNCKRQNLYDLHVLKVWMVLYNRFYSYKFNEVQR